MTSGDIAAIQSMATTEAHRIKAGVKFTREEWATALANVGATLVPPLTGPQVQALLLQQMNARRTKANVAGPAKEPKPARKRRSRGAQDLYVRWVADHDEIPNDKALAFFTGFSDASFSMARGTLRARGFEFEMPHNGTGVVKVTTRPAPPKPEPAKRTYTAEEVAEIVRKALAM